MTKEEFNKYWNMYFSNINLISNQFKNYFPNRWFRIHSLPNAQRYIQGDNDKKILLSRQNEIVSDLVGVGEALVLVVGKYISVDQIPTKLILNNQVLQEFKFIILDHIDLYKIDPSLYEENIIYIPAFAKIVWEKNHYDNLLLEMAQGNIKGFFVSFSKKLLIVPYEGGIDFILKDNLTKEKYKNKYNDWLSKRADGL
jgi:hypothetical protein